MRYQHIIEAVYHQPWLITPQGHAAVRALVESHLAESAMQFEAAKREGVGPCGENVELEQMEIIDGIAHIPVPGVIGQKLSGIEKGSGAVDVLDIEADIEEAEASEEVRSIFFDIDSPGGMVSGTPELADRILQIEKPNFAFTRGMIASAAYWLASATDGIFATKSADIGSIGVYLPWIDYTKALDQKGIKVELIKAGRLKGAGFPGVALSEEQRAHLQAGVDQIYEMFTNHVLMNRGEIDSESMQGQTFLAEAALERGLIDGIVSSKAEVLAFL